MWIAFLISVLICGTVKFNIHVHVGQGAESVPAAARLLHARKAPKKGSEECQAPAHIRARMRESVPTRGQVLETTRPLNPRVQTRRANHTHGS